MTELWAGVTVGQALIVVAAIWLLTQLTFALTGVIRRMLGLPAPVDHCEHCELIEALDDRLTELRDHTEGNGGELERIRVAVEKATDHIEEPRPMWVQR